MKGAPNGLADFEDRQLVNIAWAMAVMGPEVMRRPQFASLWGEIGARGLERLQMDRKCLLQVRRQWEDCRVVGL